MAPSVTLIINLRDSSGSPLETQGIVNLRDSAEGASRTGVTQNASAAVFQGVTQGEYDAEVSCPGFQTAQEHISVNAFGANMEVYIYLLRESEGKPNSPKPRGMVMSPKLRGEINRGLEALRHRQFEVARTHFAKGVKMAPGNPDVVCLLGIAELGLNHMDLARKHFEHGLSLDPRHEYSLLALGELQLRAGEISPAISTLEKALRISESNWRTQFLLASAYAKTGRFAEAETHAGRALSLTREKSAEPLVLLGEIQQAEGKVQEARGTWQKLVTHFPNEPAAQKAKQNLEAPSESHEARPPEELAVSFPLHALPNLDLAPPAEHPWAPPDIDSREFPVAENTPCEACAVLALAAARLRTQLQNFEKFTATEHIEHQEIDRYGQAGPVRARDFSYIVMVIPYGADSFFLEEERSAFGKNDNFPTPLATVGLNNLGVAVLQPAARERIFFRCEGLSSIRGHAAWQIYFEENEGSQATIRTWRRNGKLFRVPLKGRIWISSASYDVLRVETDLREPIEALALTRDHLSVDYGPVTFHSAETRLWLPWSAEMYMELRGQRYHHKHYLTDYLLFEVDTNHKVGKPKSVPSPAPETTQLLDPRRVYPPY